MLRFRKVHQGDAVGYFAVDGGDVVGRVTLKPLRRGGLKVGFIQVEDSHRRHKLGTALYEKAAKLACREYDGPLYSDTYRTAHAESFWQKQVAKGRASCTGEATLEEQRYAAECTDDISMVGRGKCKRYALSCPAPSSLAGTKK